MTFIKKLTVSAALAASVLLPASAFAASDSLTVTIPFAFVVNGRVLPAGPYQIDATDSSSVLFIRSGRSGLLVASNPGVAGNGSRPALVFEKRGSTEYLVAVHMEGQTDRSLPLPAVQQVSSAAPLH